MTDKIKEGDIVTARGTVKSTGCEPVIVTPKLGELLPCPFCGSEAGLEHDANGTLASWYVYCRDTKDGCPIGYDNTIGYPRRIEAATAWNKRAPSPTAETVNGEIETALHRAEVAAQRVYDGYRASEARYVIEDLAKLRAALSRASSAPAGADGWKDISTAPLDGTRVLAWHRDWETAHTAQWYGTYWGVFYKTGPLLFQPTHWMPLPAPPILAEEGTKS